MFFKSLRDTVGCLKRIETHLENIRFNGMISQEPLQLNQIDGVSYRYHKAGNESKSTKYIWMATMLLSTTVMIVILLYLFYVVDSKVTDTSSTPKNVLLIIIGIASCTAPGLLILFSGRKYKLHDQDERIFRQKALEIVAIKSFVSDVDSKKRDEIIEHLAKKIFTQDYGRIDSHHFGESILTFEEMAMCIDDLSSSILKNRKKNNEE